MVKEKYRWFKSSKETWKIRVKIKVRGWGKKIGT